MSARVRVTIGYVTRGEPLNLPDGDYVLTPAAAAPIKSYDKQIISDITTARDQLAKRCADLPAAGELPQDAEIMTLYDSEIAKGGSADSVIVRTVKAALAQRAASVPAEAVQQPAVIDVSQLRRYGAYYNSMVPMPKGNYVHIDHVTALLAALAPAASVPADERKYTQADMERFARECMAAQDARPAASVPAEAVQPVALRKLSKDEIQAIEGKFNWHNARSCGTHIRFAYAMIEAMTTSVQADEKGGTK